jgi:hypothetical protein
MPATSAASLREVRDQSRMARSRLGLNGFSSTQVWTTVAKRSTAFRSVRAASTRKGSQLRSRQVASSASCRSVRPVKWK